MGENREVLRILSHPARQRIIRLIGERGKVTFSEIRRETGLSVGVIYHHLHVLRDYLERNGSAYTFNVRGRLLYKLLREGRPTVRRSPSLSWRVLRTLLLKGVAESRFGELVFKAAAPAPFAISAAGCFLTGYAQVGFFFSKRISIDPVASAILSTALIAVTLFMAACAAQRMLLNPALLLTCSAALSPLSLYPALTMVLPNAVTPAAFVALQALTALFLTAALVNFGGLRTEVATLVVLASLYANAAALVVI